MEQVVLDGVAITDRYDVIGINRPLATPTPQIEFVPGGDRNMVRGVDLVPPEITFRVAVRELTETGRREAVRDLASLLVKDKAVKVQFGGDDGRYYMAVVSGPLEFHEFVRCGYMEVTMTCLEAAMYGDVRSASTTGESVEIEVGGTYPTALKVTADSAVRSPSSYVWGVRMDEGDYEHVELPTSSASRLVIDAEAGTVEVNGDHQQITLESDWLVAEPGRHVVRRDNGTGGFSVEWTERWL